MSQEKRNYLKKIKSPFLKIFILNIHRLTWFLNTNIHGGIETRYLWKPNLMLDQFTEQPLQNCMQILLIVVGFKCIIGDRINPWVGERIRSLDIVRILLQHLQNEQIRRINKKITKLEFILPQIYSLRGMLALSWGWSKSAFSNSNHQIAVSSMTLYQKGIYPKNYIKEMEKYRTEFNLKDSTTIVNLKKNKSKRC